MDICQEDFIEETNIAFMNSGGAPKLQTITDCKCLIRQLHATNQQMTISVLHETTTDMKFTINGQQFTSVSVVGMQVVLTFSKENSSVGGACVEIRGGQ